MCTVSFIPVGRKTFLTSNRDEKLARNKAVPPQQYKLGDVNLVFPKDGQAGGSWIALRQNGDAAVLLNGGFIKHISQPPYKRSRGLIFLEIIQADKHVQHFRQMQLDGIEPFTLVLFEEGSLYECRWDGTRKYYNQLPESRPYIWSSVTLYRQAVIKKREAWFDQWLDKNPQPVQEDILRFHLFGGEGDGHNDFRMNRNNELLTVSVTGIEINIDAAVMKYLDLSDNSIHTTKFDIISEYAA